jgi:hypothetical protein
MMGRAFTDTTAVSQATMPQQTDNPMLLINITSAFAKVAAYTTIPFLRAHVIIRPCWQVSLVFLARRSNNVKAHLGFLTAAI